MMLNKSQVKYVENYLKKNGIRNRLILNDFLDHICCEVELQIEKGHPFEESLQFVMKKLPCSELKTIELFTLKLLNMETVFSSRTALLATIPFWLFGINWAFSNSGAAIPSFIQMFLLCASILPMFVLFGIGWTKDFPAWSFPALGFCPLFTLYLMSVKIPSISNDLLGLWAFVPILVTLLVSILFKPSLKPLKHIIKRLIDNPSLVLFALYGLMPFIVWMLSDEIYALWMVPVALFSIAILSFGIYCFLRNERKRIKVLSIVLPSILSIAIVSLAVSIYWN